MKQRFSIFLVLILCFCAWAQPAAASEFSNDSWFDVLDYSTLNNSGGNVASIKTNDYVAYTLPSALIVHDVDMLVYSNDPIRYARLRRWVGDSTSFALNVESLGDNLYRITGDAVGYSFAGLYLTFTFSSGSGNIQIQRLNLLTVSSEHYTTIATATGTYGDGEEINFVKDPEDLTPAYQYFDFRNYNVDTPFVCQIYFEEWKKFDYIDIILSSSVKSIESVYAHFGNILVPVDLCFLESSDQVSSRFIAARLDLRGLDHALDWLPYLEFTGNLGGGALNVLSIASVSGYLIGNDVDPLFFYFYQLYDKLQSYFGALGQVIDEGFENLNLDQSILFSTYTDYLRSYIENQTSTLIAESTKNFGNLHTWFDDLETNLIAESTKNFGNLNTWINNSISALIIESTKNFSNLHTWIQTHTSSIISKINDFYSNLYSRLTELFLYVDSWIEIQTDAIVSAIVGDPSDSEDLDDGADRIKDDIDDIGQFEQNQQAVLDKNFDTIQDSVSIAGFAAALAFVQSYTNLIFVGVGDYIIVFLLPLFLGLFFYICSRVPGATRWRSRPPKDGGGS